MGMNAKGKYEQIGVAMTCRSYEEYIDMFQLAESDLAKGPILDVASGASSFVAGANRRGFQAIAVDPLYHLPSQHIANRGMRDIEDTTQKLASLENYYDWSYYGSLENHQQQRRRSLQVFLEDYETHSTRYIGANLPNLPFRSQSFSLIVCSHFLFLYEEQFNFDFHLSAVRELTRLLHANGELRLYPLSGFNRKPYVHLPDLIAALSDDGFTVSQQDTSFRFLHSAATYLSVVR